MTAEFNLKEIKEWDREFDKRMKELWDKLRPKPLTLDDLFITCYKKRYYSLRWSHNNRRIKSFHQCRGNSLHPGWIDNPLQRAREEATTIIDYLNKEQFDREHDYLCFGLTKMFQPYTRISKCKKHEMHSIKEEK